MDMLTKSFQKLFSQKKGEADMDIILATRLKELRKQYGVSQEHIAGVCNVSVQAVSKWECGQSYPDIALLPVLADTFHISIDNLLRGEDAAVTKSESACMNPESAYTNQDLPDDNVLRILQFKGQKLLGKNTYDPDVIIPLLIPSDKDFQKTIHLEIWGSADIEGNVGGYLNAKGDVTCGIVGGSINTNGDVTCGMVGGSVRTEGDVTCGDICGNVDCGDINGDVNAGGTVNCGDIEGEVNAGGEINCGDVGCNVNTGLNVVCGDVGGDVTAKGDVTCGDIGGDVDGGGIGGINCGNVGGNVNAAGGGVNCGDVGGDVHADGDVNCDDVGGDVNAGRAVNN